MDATTAQPTLLSAARSFIRKSAGTAVLAIAPLAAVSVAPEAKGQTIFQSITFSPGSSGSANTTLAFPSGSRFLIQGATNNNITAARMGVDGTITTDHTSGGTSVDIGLLFFTTVTNQAIPGSTVIPVSYDFTLSKQVGIVGNVGWDLSVFPSTEGFVTFASGTLTTGSATFTGSGNFTTAGPVPADLSADFNVLLRVFYTTAEDDVLFVGMNSAGQGVTINAIPEPSTYAALFGLGALGFAVLRRRFRPAA